VVERVIKFEMTFFIAVEGGSQAVQGGWPAAVVWIQCFSFDPRGEAMRRSIAER
jgi:hypothetical protein